jgi:hypothetical protein
LAGVDDGRPGPSATQWSQWQRNSADLAACHVHRNKEVPMRKILLSLSVLAGIGAVSILPASASPVRHDVPVASARIQQVDDRDWQRHDAQERAWREQQRREALRHVGRHEDRPYHDDGYVFYRR